MKKHPSEKDDSFFAWERQMREGDRASSFCVPDGKTSYERIYQVVKQIPRGRVATYGQVARLAGNPRWSRVVGYALHVNPDPEKIPCHRVVNRLGEPSSAFAFGGVNRQIALLEAEGVVFLEGRVDMQRYRWEEDCSIPRGELLL